MRAELSSGAFDKRQPYDWYVEPQWVTEQLIRAIGFREELTRGEAIWDPCCGLGNIPSAFEGWGFGGRLYLSDIVRNVDPANFLEPFKFFAADFLEVERAPATCSIVMNSPYSYRKVQGVLISELFARHALKLSHRRVCMLVPSKWLASQSRYRLFTEHPPFAVLHLCQRPSMPPGDRIAAMGDRAFRGGMVDYCWIVWDVTRPTRRNETRTVWLPPLGEPISPIEALQ